MKRASAFPDEAAAWLPIGLLAAATLWGLAFAHFAIAWAGMIGPLAGAVALVAISRFYRARRADLRLAMTCAALAQLISFTAVAGPLSYLAAAADLPLQDARFAAADSATGLDWMAYLAIVNSSPSLIRVFGFTYSTLMPQLAAALLVLGLGGRLRDLRILVWAAGISGVAGILVSGLWPAIDCYTHYGLTKAAYSHFTPSGAVSYVADFLHVRDGSLRVIDLRTAQGIITFPSFHAALGGLYARSFWQNRWARWPGVAFEAAMVIGTPIEGGHYFVDVGAGLLLAAGSLVAAARIVDGLARRRIVGSIPAAAPLPA